LGVLIYLKWDVEPKSDILISLIKYFNFMTPEHPTNYPEFSNNVEQNEKPKLGLEQLPKVVEYLQSLGLRSAIHDIEDAKQYLQTFGHSLPLVRDGVDGIRADYDKRRDELKIWFTNGYEDPENEQRQEIKNWIKENFTTS
jgi:hypothetical protein